MNVRQLVRAYSERKTFIDGDLISLLFDKSKKEQDDLMAKLNAELKLSPEDLEKILEYVQTKTLAIPARLSNPKLRIEHVRVLLSN